MTSPPTPLRLAPGLRLVRRDADHLQLGLDPPRMVVLPDLPEVRRLVDALVAGAPLDRLGPEAARALDRISAAGLLVAPGPTATRRADVRVQMHVDACPETEATLAALLAQADVATSDGRDEADDGGGVALVVSDTEVARGPLDQLVGAGTPHLVVGGSAVGITVGPFVLPGRTACLRCVDAHRGEADPRRALVVEQLAAVPPTGRDRGDPALRTLALAWAVRDLVTFLEGGRPACWSATVRVDAELDLRPQSWLRHLHCGCAWGDGLAVAG